MTDAPRHRASSQRRDLTQRERAVLIALAALVVLALVIVAL